MSSKKRKLTWNKRKRTSSMTIIIKTGIVEDHHQRKSSMCGTKINMGNANRQWWSSTNGNRYIVCVKCVWQWMVWKSVMSNPSIARPRPFSPFPKVYTKHMKKHVPHTGKWGSGDRHVMKIVKEIIKNTWKPEWKSLSSHMYNWILRYSP